MRTSTGIAEEYAGSEAAIEATGNYFTVCDALDEHHVEVLVKSLPGSTPPQES